MHVIVTVYFLSLLHCPTINELAKLPKGCWLEHWRKPKMHWRSRDSAILAFLGKIHLLPIYLYLRWVIAMVLNCHPHLFFQNMPGSLIEDTTLNAPSIEITVHFFNPVKYTQFDISCIVPHWRKCWWWLVSGRAQNSWHHQKAEMVPRWSSGSITTTATLIQHCYPGCEPSDTSFAGNTLTWGHFILPCMNFTLFPNTSERIWFMAKIQIRKCPNTWSGGARYPWEYGWLCGTKS